MNINWKLAVAYLELSLAMIIAGSSVVVGKLIIGDFPVFLANGLALLVAAVTILPVQFAVKKKLPKLGRKDFFYILLQAFFGLFLFRVFVLYGLNLTSAIEAGIITSTTPAWIALIAFIFLREKIGFSKGAGILLSVMGIVVINVLDASSDAKLSLMHVLGNALIVGAVIGEAIFTILRKSISSKVDALSGVTFVVLFGLVMFLPLAINEAMSFQFSAVKIIDWIPIVYWGAGVTVVGFFLWFDGVTKVAASTAGVFSALMPVSTVVLSTLILAEKMHWFHGLGIILVLAGIFLSVELFSKKGAGAE